MRLTTKSEYAVRAIICLASLSPCLPSIGGQAAGREDRPIQIREIATLEGISKPYIEQLFMRLRKSGLIKSLRGPTGGYVLAKKTSQITIGNIVRSVEGPISLMRCLTSAPGCNKSLTCKSYPMWKKVNNKVEAALDSISIKDLL